MKKIVKKWFFWPLLVGVAIRLLVAPFTLHPDLLGHSFVVYFFSEKRIFKIYEYLWSLPQTHPLVKNFGVGDIFIYPPLSYFTLGIFRILAKPFVSSDFVPWAWSNLDKITQYPHLFKILFWYNFFYLPFDVGIAFLLASLFQEARKKKLVFWLWMLNPVAIYATFMIGQLDVLPTFFVVLAIWFFAKKKVKEGMLSLGVAAAYKMFPLFLIFPAAFLLAKKFWRKIWLILVGLFPFFLTIAPFLSSPSFRGMVLFCPKSQKMLFMGWPVSGAEVVYPFLLFLVFIFYLAWFHYKEKEVDFYFLAILLLIFSVTHFHPQWFLWVTPFLIIELGKDGEKVWPVVLSIFLAWLGITLLFEPSLSIGLFSPLIPELADQKGLAEIMPAAFDAFKVKSMLRSVLAGSSLFFLWFHGRDRNTRK